MAAEQEWHRRLHEGIELPVPYALAAVAGMQGQHQVAVAAFEQMLRLALRSSTS